MLHVQFHSEYNDKFRNKCPATINYDPTNIQFLKYNKSNTPISLHSQPFLVATPFLRIQIQFR